MVQFLGYLHSSAMATPFTITESTDVSWGPKAYHKEAVTSLSHCAVLCRMSSTSNQACNMFSWDGTDCTLGRQDYTGTSPGVPSGISTVYVEPGLFAEEESKYRAVEPVTTNWFPRFFSVGYDSATAPPTISSCIAEFFASSYDSMAIFPDTAANKCWFGMPAATTGSFAPAGSSWSVYVKDSKYSLRHPLSREILLSIFVMFRPPVG